MAHSFVGFIYWKCKVDLPNLSQNQLVSRSVSREPEERVISPVYSADVELWPLRTPKRHLWPVGVTGNYGGSVGTPTSSDLIKFHLNSAAVTENSAVAEMWLNYSLLLSYGLVSIHTYRFRPSLLRIHHLQYREEAERIMTETHSKWGISGSDSASRDSSNYFFTRHPKTDFYASYPRHHDLSL
jgi:hypothetical protein